ncbi:MAG: helix-turn-helix domain-containing protein [Lentisphaeraceae bacterium]|nr:helix-turn-helix domain-containing protein [Lentisphaeraceae bacterium]
MNNIHQASEYWQKVDSTNYTESIIKLFNHLSGIYIFAKDENGVFTLANQLHVERCGRQQAHEVLGKTDFDFMPVSMAEKYVSDDKKVMSTGIPIVDLTELCLDSNGCIDFFLVNKQPLFYKDGSNAGIIGISQNYNMECRDAETYYNIYPAIQHIKANYNKPLSISELAELTGLSIRKFEEKFKEHFHVPPKQYLTKTRLNMACEMLMKSDMLVTEIALKVGFYDHSAFTRHFTKNLNLTPKAYRRKYSRQGY